MQECSKVSKASARPGKGLRDMKRSSKFSIDASEMHKNFRIQEDTDNLKHEAHSPGDDAIWCTRKPGCIYGSIGLLDSVHGGGARSHASYCHTLM